MKRFISVFWHAFLAAFVAGLWIGTPVLAEAGIKVKAKTSYYQVKGRNGKELSINMIKEGRKKIPLDHAIAATQYGFDYQEPKIGIKNGQCIIENVQVLLDVEYIYPKWTNRAQGSREMRRNWDQFYNELKRHEQQHGEIAKKGAIALEKEFRKIRGNTVFGCRDMGRFAAFRLNNILRKTRAEQKAFDRREYSSRSKISKLQNKLFQSE